jgi:hypothetical protein
MGGTDDLSNIVRLTPEEHFVAHQLLVKIYPTIPELVMAVRYMCYGSYKNGGRIGNKLFGWLRRKHMEVMREINAGKKLSQETINRIRESKKGHTHSEETKLKIAKSHLNKLHSPETKIKMSQSQRGREGQPMPETTKLALIRANTGRSPANKGIPMPEETKRKIIKTMAPIYESRRGIPMKIITCPHCNKSGNRIVMPRWHFDNCKMITHIQRL